MLSHIKKKLKSVIPFPLVEVLNFSERLHFCSGWQNYCIIGHLLYSGLIFQDINSNMKKNQQLPGLRRRRFANCSHWLFLLSHWLMKMDQPALGSGYLHQCKATQVAFTNFLSTLRVVKYPLTCFSPSPSQLTSCIHLKKTNQNKTGIMFLVIIMTFHEINIIYYTRIRRHYVLMYCAI